MHDQDFLSLGLQDYEINNLIKVGGGTTLVLVGDLWFKSSIVATRNYLIFNKQVGLFVPINFYEKKQKTNSTTNLC